MQRLLTIYITFFVVILFVQIGAATRRVYTSGIANLVRRAVQHSVNRLIFRQTYYDSDVFRYTQLSKRSAGGLYKGESCRLQASICSFDEHCCSGRCLCRRWAVTGEQRCVRKCF